MEQILTLKPGECGPQGTLPCQCSPSLFDALLKDLDFATDRDVREEWAVPAYPVAPLALLKLASEQAIELDKLRCWADAKHLVGSYVEPSRNH